MPFSIAHNEPTLFPSLKTAPILLGTSLFVFLTVSTVWFGGLAYAIVHRHTSESARRFAWGVAGGSLTGFQNFLKDSLTIWQDDSQETVVYLWLMSLVLCQIVASLGGLLLLNACMKRYDATFSAAMFVGSFVLMTSIMSSVHYDTFQHLHGNVVNLILYPTGLLVLVGGVYRLADHVK